jgi:hypothetical protein
MTQQEIYKALASTKYVSHGQIDMGIIMNMMNVVYWSLTQSYHHKQTTTWLSLLDTTYNWISNNDPNGIYNFL